MAGFPAWTRTPCVSHEGPVSTTSPSCCCRCFSSTRLALVQKTRARGTVMPHPGTSISCSVRRVRICLFKALVAFAVSSLGWPGGPSLTSLFSHHTANFLPLHNQLTLELLKPGGLCQPLFCLAQALTGPLAPIKGSAGGTTGRGWGWGLRMEPPPHPHSLQDLNAEYFSGTPGRPAHPCPPQLWPEARSPILPTQASGSCPLTHLPTKHVDCKDRKRGSPQPPGVRMLCLA